MPVGGGFPTELPLPPWDRRRFYSPDGKISSMCRFFNGSHDWKQYHGGQTTPIWIANLADSSITKIPRDNSNDKNPMWVGNTIYFLSDRGGPVTLFGYDLNTKAVTELVT